MRYVIKNPSGQHLSNHEILRVTDVIEADGLGNKFVHQRHIVAPIFEGGIRSAVKFDTREDAAAAMTNPFLDDPKAFDGCEVAEVPDFNP